MIQSIIAYSVKNKPITLLLTLAMAIFGGYSLSTLPIDAVPDITNNQVQIVTQNPALSPEEVERFISYPLEIGMQNLPGAKEVRSISKYGLSIVTVVFADAVPVLDARQFVQEKLNQQDYKYGKSSMMPITTGLGEIYQYTLQVQPGFSYSPMELREIQDWIVKKRFSGIEGVVDVSSFGGFIRQYEIIPDPLKLNAFGLDVSDLEQVVRKSNSNSGSSYFVDQREAVYIRGEGMIKSLEDLGNTPLESIGGIPVLLKDVAETRWGYAPRFGALTMDGRGEVVGGISLMLKGGNSYHITQLIKDRVEELNSSMPEGVKIAPYLDRSTLVSRTIDTVVENLTIGGASVIFVLVLLMGHFGGGLLVASVIPLSFLFSAILMKAFGISANLMSLGALDFGIVVDGAVIIVEGILFRMVKSSNKGALEKSTKEFQIIEISRRLYNPAVFGIGIILIVFLPILSLTNIEGKMFRPLAQVFGLTLLGSLLLSITYVPAMATFLDFGKGKKRLPQKLLDKLANGYSAVLSGLLERPRMLIAPSLILLIFSCYSLSRMGREFIPSLEEGDLAIQMAMPQGSILSETIRFTTRTEKILLEEFPEVVQVVSKIGTAEIPTDPMSIEDADIMVLLKPKSEWISAASKEELISKMETALEPLRVPEFEFTQPIQLRFNELLTGSKSDIAVKVFGDNLDSLVYYASKALVEIEGVVGAHDVRMEKVEGLEQLNIRIDRDLIGFYQLNTEAVLKAIQSLKSGVILGQVFEGDRAFDISIKYSGEPAIKPDLDNVLLKAHDGNLIPLSKVTQIRRIKGPNKILRDNGYRRVSIGVNVRGKDLSGVVNEINEKLKRIALAPGYHWQLGGKYEQMIHAQNRLLLVIPLSVLLIAIMLFLALRSSKLVLMVFMAIPVSFVGGVFLLWMREMPLSISSGIGFIALFGISVLNGLVLINALTEVNPNASNIKSLLVRSASTRLRPILLTGLTDILGFLPMALSTSAGAEVQQPLATVVIGGILTASFMVLFILPVMYFNFYLKQNERKV